MNPVVQHRGVEPLSTASERARIDEVERHRAAGAAGVEPLLFMLVDESWVVRRHVVEALAALGDLAVGGLVDLLATDRTSETRIAATVDALVMSESEHAVSAVAKLVDSEDAAVVADVAQILGRRRARDATTLLDALARHEDDNVAVAAIEALGRLGGRGAVNTLVEIVREKNFFRTFPALDILGRSGDPRAVEPLTELLDVPHFAMEAVRALGRTGDPAAAEPLVRQLHRTNSAMVRVACAALCDLERRHARRFGANPSVDRQVRSHAPPSAVRVVASAFGQATQDERRDMVTVLGLLADEAAIPHLTSLLGDEPAVAAAAAEALTRISSAGADHVVAAVRGADSEHRRVLLKVLRAQRRSSDAVIECLDDPDPTVRAVACEVLARLGDKSVVEDVFARLDDPDMRVVQTAIGTIQALGSEQTESLALEAATSESPRRRRAALRILGYFGYASATPVLVDALESDDPRIREAALQGLPLIDDVRARQALLDAATAPSARVRASAMRALGSSEAAPTVSEALERGLDDEDAWVRYYAVQALGRLGIETAASGIAARLGDAAGQVRVSAVEALAQIGGDEAREHLIDALDAPEPDMRRAALLGLGLTAHPDDLDTLLSYADADDLPTRLVALSALERYGGARVLEVMQRTVHEPVVSLRNAALGFLASNPSREATLALVEVVQAIQRQPPADAAEDLLTAVGDALATWSPMRVEALVEAATDADDELAPLVMSALVRMRRVESRRALMRILRDAGVPGRKAAAAALASSREPEVIAALSERMSSDEDIEVRRICSALLSR